MIPEGSGLVPKSRSRDGRLAAHDAEGPDGRVAFPAALAYADVVSAPVINVEEHIDRVVGRRTKAPDPLSLTSSRKADAEAWRKAFGGLRVRRGVHRFRTHEEADAWLWRMMARPTRTS
jgi:hypothetical protein